MKDHISKIETRINQLKQKKEKLQTKEAILLSKEAQLILQDQFSSELVLTILLNSWDSAPLKQKEEWINSAHSFRKVSNKQNSKGTPNPQHDSSQNPTEDL